MDDRVYDFHHHSLRHLALRLLSQEGNQREERRCEWDANDVTDQDLLLGPEKFKTHLGSPLRVADIFQSPFIIIYLFPLDLFGDQLLTDDFDSTSVLFPV